MHKNAKEYLPKKRIAFLGGGVHLIPSYKSLLNELCKNYTITLYSEFYLDTTSNVRYSIRSVSQRIPGKLRNLLFAWMIIKDHLINPFSLIHSHSTFPSGFWGLIISKVLGVKIVVSLDAAEASAFPEFNFGDLLNSKRKWINKWVINQADEVIVLTDFLLNEVRNNLKISRSIHIIPRGIDINKFQFLEKPINRPIRFLNVAYLHPVKDQEMLIKAFAKISTETECFLTHIGKDLSNGKIHQLVKDMKLEDKVNFIGFIPNEDLALHYSQADILLHTSRFESQAVVVCEAMASGVVICGTHVGLLADLSSSCCLTVGPGDINSFAEKVLRLLENPKEIKRLSYNGYNWSISHDINWTAQKHEEIYKDLLYI